MFPSPPRCLKRDRMRRDFKPCQVCRISSAGGVGMGAKEMADREFDADEHIKLIKKCLADTAKDLVKAGRMTNNDWTHECLRALADLGESEFKYNAAPCPRCVEHGWLYDLIWWKGKKGEMTDLILALESEWSPSIQFVRYDFQKLIQARARIKVLISDSLKSEDCQTLISDIDNFEQNENDGEYLFAMYNGNSKTFEFYSKETLCKCCASA